MSSTSEHTIPSPCGDTNQPNTNNDKDTTTAPFIDPNSTKPTDDTPSPIPPTDQPKPKPTTSFPYANLGPMQITRSTTNSNNGMSFPYGPQGSERTSSSGISFPYGPGSSSSQSTSRGVSFPYGNPSSTPGSNITGPPGMMGMGIPAGMMMMMGMPPPPGMIMGMRPPQKDQLEEHSQGQGDEKKEHNIASITHHSSSSSSTTTIEKFTNTRHTNPHRNDTIVGTDGLPQERYQYIDDNTNEQCDALHTKNNLCGCGQYHSVLSPSATLIRRGYQLLLRGGTFEEAIEMCSEGNNSNNDNDNNHNNNNDNNNNDTDNTTTVPKSPTPMSPFQLMMEMNKFLAYWSQHDGESFGEVIQDDLRRKKIGVKEDLIEVSLDSTPIITQSDRLGAMDVVTQTGEVTKLIAPLIQEQVEKIECDGCD